MALRANWKGFLKLSLVTCPIAMFPATSEADKINFNQLNKKTGNRIKYQKVDAETGDQVEADDIVKGYKVDKDRYITIDKEELEAISIDSTRTIDIDQFVPRTEIDDVFLVRPYYLVPDGKVGHDAFAVIRDTIKATGKVALGRLVLTSREHVIALEARDKGIMGMLLRYPYEVRDSADYFDGIQDVNLTKEMLDLARHIVEQKSAHFDPDKFEDRYETALSELLKTKQAGKPIRAAKQEAPSNVVNLMDALRRSLGKPSVKPAVAAQAEPKKRAKKAPANRKTS